RKLWVLLLSTVDLHLRYFQGEWLLALCFRGRRVTRPYMTPRVTRPRLRYLVMICLCSTAPPVTVSLFRAGVAFLAAGAAPVSAMPGLLFTVVGLIMISTRRCVH